MTIEIGSLLVVGLTTINHEQIKKFRKLILKFEEFENNKYETI